MPRKKRLAIIISIVTLIIILIVGILAFLYIKTDAFKTNETLFTKYFVAKMSLSSILKTLAVLLIYFVNIKIFDLSTATTMAFLTLILLEIVFAYSCRNIREPVLGNKIFANSHLNKSTIFLLIIQTIIMITPLKSIFGIETLSFIQVMYTIFVVFICYLIDELSKTLLTKIFKD